MSMKGPEEKRFEGDSGCPFTIPTRFGALVGLRTFCWTLRRTRNSSPATDFRVVLVDRHLVISGGIVFSLHFTTEGARAAQLRSCCAAAAQHVLVRTQRDPPLWPHEDRNNPCVKRWTSLDNIGRPEGDP